MKKAFACVGAAATGMLALALLAAAPAKAQDPIVTPIIVDEAASIVVKAVTPKPKTGIQKFEGTFLNGNIAQVTVKARGNDMGIETFSLSETASSKMQKIIDNGGYQYGDKITVYYDAQTRQALKVKGKPSRPL